MKHIFKLFVRPPKWVQNTFDQVKGKQFVGFLFIFSMVQVQVQVQVQALNKFNIFLLGSIVG